jgi:putative DNA primase/helicase
MYYLADINGKMANYCDDMSNKDFSGGDFKQFTSGAKFSARHPYGRPFVVRRVPLMMCCVNEVPPTTDDTDGYFRRLLPIMCPAKIADHEVDTELPNKLSTDEAKCGIFNWILGGYKSLMDAKGKISVSDSIAGMKELIREDSNSARRWVRYERFVKVEPLGPNDDNWRSMSEYMEMYKDYCIKHIEPTKTAKSIAKLFGELGFAREERRSGIWYCIGRADVEFEADRSAIIEDEAELPF